MSGTNLTALPINLTFDQALNQSSGIPRGANQLTLQFPIGISVSGCHVALADLNIPVSWPNVSSSVYNNATFIYAWIDGSTNVVTLPDLQEQTPASINLFLQEVMTTNTHYLENSSPTGAPMYFLEISQNLSASRTELTSTPVPTSLPSGYTLPDSATWSLPGVATNPEFVIPSGFGQLQGFTSGSYPATNVGVLYQILGQSAPANPVQQVFVQLDRALNLVQPGANNVIYSFPMSQPYGQVQRETPPVWRWVQMMDGLFTNLTVTLVDQLNRALPVQDTNFSCSIQVKRLYRR